MSFNLKLVLFLFFAFIVFAFGIFFVGSNFDFLECFSNVFDLGDVYYDFPNPSSFVYNINFPSKNISFTTNKEYFLKNGDNVLLYRDHDLESDIVVRFLDRENFDLSSYYNSFYDITNESNVFKDSLGDGHSYFEFFDDDYFYVDVFFVFDDVVLSFCFSSKLDFKDKYLSSFRDWASNIQITEV
ncbi:MAG: hypothetical protein HFE04_01235 [Bacilli bacterium]|nr:hypothetical protein [Bacilli bacterium]